VEVPPHPQPTPHPPPTHPPPGSPAQTPASPSAPRHRLVSTTVRPGASTSCACLGRLGVGGVVGAIRVVVKWMGGGLGFGVCGLRVVTMTFLDWRREQAQLMLSRDTLVISMQSNPPQTPESNPKHPTPIPHPNPQPSSHQHQHQHSPAGLGRCPTACCAIWGIQSSGMPLNLVRSSASKSAAVV